MCVGLDPVTATLEFAVSVGRAVNQIQNANAEKAMGEYQTNMLIDNAKKEEEKAREEYQTGVEESRQAKLQSILRMGTNKTNIASGNIALSSSTAMNVLSDEESYGELEALNVFNQYKKRSDSYFDSSKNYYDRASLNAFNVKQRYRNNMFNASSSFLSTGEKMVNFIGAFKK